MKLSHKILHIVSIVCIVVAFILCAIPLYVSTKDTTFTYSIFGLAYCYTGVYSGILTGQIFGMVAGVFAIFGLVATLMNGKSGVVFSSLFSFLCGTTAAVLTYLTQVFFTYNDAVYVPRDFTSTGTCWIVASLFVVSAVIELICVIKTTKEIGLEKKQSQPKDIK